MDILTPYIPEFITVHLGAPDSNAQNVVVSFPEYIKNVASSEIYPTWKNSAILANIYAQISFALNRVFLEHYICQGYNFNITSLPAYDQNFVLGRNIFDNIGMIVDEIFNNYIRRVGFMEPLAAKYCNGTTTICEGLSQWGSNDLATNGYNSVQILKYYYGDDIEIVANAPILGIRTLYPGIPVKLGNEGTNVALIQNFLNRISQNYPLIPKINPANSIFDTSTENAVKQFQRIFNLNPNGIVDKATWYKIMFIYSGIKNLSELESEGLNLFGLTLEYPDAISEGESGEKVYILQYMLALSSKFFPIIPITEITGTFDSNTKNAVIAVQKAAGLPQNGIVNDATWDEIYRYYSGILDNVFSVNSQESIATVPFQGTVLTVGSTGEDVMVLQQYLNQISIEYPSISPIPVTGAFDEQTKNSVIQYQNQFDLPPTGEVDRDVWNHITNTYKDILSAHTSHQTQNPGHPLIIGSSDHN